MYDPLIDIPDRNARKWAMLCHLGGLARITLVPFTGILLPLIVWLAKQDEHPYIDEQGREAVNFQFTLSVMSVATWLTIGALKWIPIIGLLRYPLYILLPLIWIMAIGGAIYAGLRANEGEDFRYPFSFNICRR